MGEPLRLSPPSSAPLSWLFPQLPLLHRLQCHRFTAGSESGATASASPQIKRSSRPASSCFFHNSFQNSSESVAGGEDLGSVLPRKVRIFLSETLLFRLSRSDFLAFSQSAEPRGEAKLRGRILLSWFLRKSAGFDFSANSVHGTIPSISKKKKKIAAAAAVVLLY